MPFKAFPGQFKDPKTKHPLKMLPRVYIETTIVSYLSARDSRDVVSLARKQITTEWWKVRRSLFSPCVSSVVLDEAGRGDEAAANKRIRFIADLPLLDFNRKSIQLAEAFIVEGALPEIAADDAAHIAVCAVHCVPYLLTWNFRHIANASKREQLSSICTRHGLPLPVICTPEEL